MTGRTKFIISIIVIVIIFFAFIMLQSYYLYSDTAKRSTSTLLNQYYRSIGNNPEAAKRALELIISQEPKNIAARRELSFWYLRQGDTKSAIIEFEKTHALFPDDMNIKKQLALLKNTFTNTAKSNVVTNQPKKSTLKLSSLDLLGNKPINPNKSHLQQTIEDALPTPSTIAMPAVIQEEQQTASLKPTTTQTKQVVYAGTTERDKLLNEFYQTKQTNPAQAWKAINKLLSLYPDDLIALKEAGYFALGQNQKALSVSYFKRAYDVSHDPYLALQTAYILDGLDEKREAYHYFDLATQTDNLDERMKAEIAKTNLRGTRTQFLPKPFFADILFYPFYRSRFKLIIYPVIARVGVVLNERYNISTYIIYRRTSDNKSNVGEQLPQIYEDNAAITSLGLRAAPFKSFPVSGFIEAGKAVDLVYKNRARWRNDFRMGLIYYNDWGKSASYTFTPRFPMRPNMDLYTDLIYFSRYLNTIGTMRLRPGLEVFRYGSSALNLYLKAFLSEDQSRIFYNNILETGPGIAFTPNDRYNVVFRYENLRGFYLPCSGASQNPYSRTYHNNYFFIDTFVSF